jgi:hypothetical protein
MLATVFYAWPICNERFPTPFTNLRLASDSIISAFTRTVFNRSVNSLSRIKSLTAVSTYRSTALITNQCCTRSGRKMLTTLSTFLNRCNDREGGFVIKLRMVIPKFLFCCTVTGRAKRYQIFKFIGFTIIRKQSERGNMMNRKTLALCTAMLAGVVISLTRGLALFIPVCSTIGTMPTTPCGIFATRINTGKRSPLIVTFTTAKVEFENRTRYFLEFRTAVCTCYRNAVSTSALMISRLPSGIALKPTKRVLGHRNLITLTLNRLTAFSTIHSNHHHIIACMDNSS